MSASAKRPVMRGSVADKADASGKETDPDGRELITVSRLLELGSFSNPRRAYVSA